MFFQLVNKNTKIDARRRPKFTKTGVKFTKRPNMLKKGRCFWKKEKNTYLCTSEQTDQEQSRKMTLFFCLLPTFACAFWCMALFISYFEHRQKDKFLLAVFMLAGTLLYACHVVYFTRSKELLPQSDTIYCMLNLTVFPLYYYYVCQVTERHSRFRVWPMLPALSGVLTVGVLYFTMTKEETDTFINHYLYEGRWDLPKGLAYVQAVVHQALRVLFVLIIIPIVHLSWKKTKDYNSHVRNFFADSDDKVFVIPKSLVTLFVIAVVSSILCSVLGRMYFNHSIILLAIPSLIFSCLLFLIGYKGFTRQFSSVEFNERIEMIKSREEQLLSANQQSADSEGGEETANEESPSSDPDVCGDNSFAELGKRINELMYERRIYLNHNLTINDLAVMLGTNREYIYRAMKEIIGLSFSEMVNRLRVEHAAKMLQEHPATSMLLLADESGFASVTSFYRNFKLYKGCTPKQWLKRHDV